VRGLGIETRRLLIAILAVTCHGAHAQTTQFLPEIDTYVKLAPEVRFTFQVKGTREGGDPTQAEIGPSLDFFLKPWLKLQNVTAFDLDDAKKRPLVFSVGYRALPSPNAPFENRMELAATPHLPLSVTMLMYDRNRIELDWQSGKFTWRYRNLLAVEKTFAIRSYHPRAYAKVEEFYESQYQKWSTTALYAGGTFPIGQHVELSPYYEHQNNTGKKPNQQLNQVGLILNLYFGAEGK